MRGWAEDPSGRTLRREGPGQGSLAAYPDLEFWCSAMSAPTYGHEAQGAASPGKSALEALLGAAFP